MDDLYQKRFFPASITNHCADNIHFNWWYWDYLWYNNTLNDLRCCSDTFCSMHYVGQQQSLKLEYLIYRVHPYGLDKNSTEKLPRKLPLQEIIDASNIKGWGKEYRDHEHVLHLDPSEIY
jgi:hypothetical protein